mgnify:CR=1 FL=1
MSAPVGHPGPAPEKVVHAITLIANGMTQSEVAKELMVSRRTIYGWLQAYPELHQAIHDAVRAAATAERPANLTWLIRIRDAGNTGNRDRMDAIEKIDARAGAITKQEAGLKTVVLIAGNEFNFGEIPSTELDRLIRKIANVADPTGEAVRVVDGELVDCTKPGVSAEDAGSAHRDAAASGSGEAAAVPDPAP